MNNRQNGRRRGRGGQQARNGQPGGPGNGSRLDNRARGNAAQLLEKYKTLARDAQMQGDRVNTEYYLQFADHYFRVLSETRARFEEQRPRQQNDYRDDFGGDDEGDDMPQGRVDQQIDAWDDGDGQSEPASRDVQPQEAPRREPAPRTERAQTSRDGAREGARDGEGRRERSRRTPRAAAPAATVEAADGNRAQDDGETAGFAPDFMAQRIEAQPENPSLTQDVAENVGEAEDAPKPRRRTRRPRAEVATVDA
ncbi:DUF4167 domain-containing protein [uncultured Sphingomonas sp.]|uniref:DUF4167 domain-containing protein n=1 Tax=uncultured Sphingomonas sp. TaxID=158754 RepID=UPI0025FDDFDB|nr:DUF4167 domain-containing protein [uncultured Sphingomonas sp.]